MSWLKLDVRLIVTKLCQCCHLLNWSNLVEHIKSSLIELGLKFLFRVAYFTDGKKHPPQACREGGAKGVLVPPPPQQTSEVHFLIDQRLKMKWNRVLKCDVIKMKFLKLWDLSGYSERDRSKINWKCRKQVTSLTHTLSHPRRPRGSQPGWEKRRNESF